VVRGLTHRCGYRITCQRGVHVPPRRRRTTCRILSPSHDPTESRIVVRRRPFAGDASVWNPVRQLLRASGQHRGAAAYRAGLTVREEQEPFGGWTPDRGYVELRARAVITARSMVAFWMVGLEDRPERSAEICVAGIFGNTMEPGNRPWSAWDYTRSGTRQYGKTFMPFGCPSMWHSSTVTQSTRRSIRPPSTWTEQRYAVVLGRRRIRCK
jgi:hypothetical protein